MTIVIGSQNDVPDVGDPIVSPWHQDTAKKIVHVFATTVARDAWTNPPDGAVCQAPAGTWFNRVAGAWVPFAALAATCWIYQPGYAAPNVASVPIPFTAADVVDTHNMHDPAVNPSRVQIPYSGLWTASIVTEWASGAVASLLEMFTAINGATASAGRHCWVRWKATTTGEAPTATVTDVMRLTAGNYVEMYVFHDSGGARFVNSRLALRYLGPI